MTVPPLRPSPWRPRGCQKRKENNGNKGNTSCSKRYNGCLCVVIRASRWRVTLITSAYQCVVISTPKWAEINNISEPNEKVSTLESQHTNLKKQWPPGQVESDPRPMMIERWPMGQ